MRASSTHQQGAPVTALENWHINRSCSAKKASSSTGGSCGFMILVSNQQRVKANKQAHHTPARVIGSLALALQQ
jgi:hypothetical protein